MVPYHTWARGYSKIHIELKFRKTNFFTKLISRNNFVQIFRFPKVTVCSSIQCVEIKETHYGNSENSLPRNFFVKSSHLRNL